MNIKVARGLSYLGAAILLALAWLGITGGIEQWSESVSVGQRVQTLAQFAYGLLSIVVVVSWFSTRRFVDPVQAVWLVSLTMAGGLAPVVWGNTGWGPGVAAGLSAAVVGLLILWLLRHETRNPA